MAKRQKRMTAVPVAPELVVDYDGPALPQSLIDLTPEQQEGVVQYLASLPLEELRRRQDVCSSEESRAYCQRNMLAVGNLLIKQSLLTLAIMRREF